MRSGNEIHSLRCATVTIALLLRGILRFRDSYRVSFRFYSACFSHAVQSLTLKPVLSPFANTTVATAPLGQLDPVPNARPWRMLHRLLHFNESYISFL